MVTELLNTFAFKYFVSNIHHQGQLVVPYLYSMVLQVSLYHVSTLILPYAATSMLKLALLYKYTRHATEYRYGLTGINRVIITLLE